MRITGGENRVGQLVAALLHLPANPAKVIADHERRSNMQHSLKALTLGIMLWGLLVAFALYLNAAPDHSREQLRNSRLCEADAISCN